MKTSRRFLLAASLARLILRERGGIRQIEGYFPERDGRAASVLLTDHKGVLVLRHRHENGFAEERTEVPRSHAEALLDVAAGEIDYIRTTLPTRNYDVLMDRFIGPDRLDILTIEFESADDAQAFHALSWFGPEVTTDERYNRCTIAMEGAPPPEELGLSNKVLGHLLDTLENHFTDVRPRQRPLANPAPHGKAHPLNAQPLSGGSGAGGSGR